MNECYFTPNKKYTSSTICVNCGQEKYLHTTGEGLKSSIVKIITTPTMTREEQLKQAIEGYFNNLKKLGYSPSDLTPYFNSILSTPSILRHADPEIMKQAGWVREDEWISVSKLKPLAYETNRVWDGKRSDLVLVADIEGNVKLARYYEGVLDGSEFKDWYDDTYYELSIKPYKWKKIF